MLKHKKAKKKIHYYSFHLSPTLRPRPIECNTSVKKLWRRVEVRLFQSEQVIMSFGFFFWLIVPYLRKKLTRAP